MILGIVEAQGRITSLEAKEEESSRLLNYGFKAYNSANQSCADATDTTLDFDTDIWNYGKVHDETTNSSKALIPEDGRFKLGCNIIFASNAVGYRRVILKRTKINGIVQNLFRSSKPAVNGDVTSFAIEITDDFIGGEIVEVVAFQNSGGALNVVTLNSILPSFWMQGVTNLAEI